MSRPLIIHLLKDQLGSLYIQDALMPCKKEERVITHHRDHAEMATAISAQPGLSMGESFHEDKAMLTGLTHLPYEQRSLNKIEKLSTRDLKDNTIIHIDLRIIEPHRASAIEPHLIVPEFYISWEDLMADLLSIKNPQKIQHFHISGFCPDRDRNIQLNIMSKHHSFHLNSTQETHQYTLGLMYNCMELLEGK